MPIAKQIAEALAAAHESGIIHRDLKPANLALASNDQVKVLDFGLAKLAQPEGLTSSDPSVSPTITSPAMMTGVGMILGTAAYMSPEQAKGGVVDKRSDIWAFGAVLYEMLTARRAFEGVTSPTRWRRSNEARADKCVGDAVKWRNAHSFRGSKSPRGSLRWRKECDEIVSLCVGSRPE